MKTRRRNLFFIAILLCSIILATSLLLRAQSPQTIITELLDILFTIDDEEMPVLLASKVFYIGEGGELDKKEIDEVQNKWEQKMQELYGNYFTAAGLAKFANNSDIFTIMYLLNNQPEPFAIKIIDLNLYNIDKNGYYYFEATVTLNNNTTDLTSISGYASFDEKRRLNNFVFRDISRLWSNMELPLNFGQISN